MSRTLDARGLVCPLPVLKTRKALVAVSVGETLTVLATDPASRIDIRHFCDMTGHPLISATEDAGLFTYVIRKSPPADPSP